MADAASAASALSALDKTQRRTVQALVAAGYAQAAVLEHLEAAAWDVKVAAASLVTAYGSPAVLPPAKPTPAPGAAAGGAGAPGACRARAAPGRGRLARLARGARVSSSAPLTARDPRPLLARPPAARLPPQQ